MEKQIIELLGKMNVQLEVMNERIGKIEIRMDKLEVRMDKMENRMGKLEVRMDKMDKVFLEVNARLDNGFKEISLLFSSADKRFDRLDQRLIPLEELIKETFIKDVKYLKHKVSQIEQEVYLINSKN